MNILIVGLAIFIGVHLVPALIPVKAGLQKELGASGYKGAFSLISAIGLGLIIWGMIKAPELVVFTSPEWAKMVAMLVMPVPMILLASANMKGHIRAMSRHPMMLGILIWAALHFVANGDQASIWLFGSFGLFAIFSIVTGNMRGEAPVFEIQKRHDYMAIGGGLAVYVAFLFLHPVLIGVKLL